MQGCWTPLIEPETLLQLAVELAVVLAAVLAVLAVLALVPVLPTFDHELLETSWVWVDWVLLLLLSFLLGLGRCVAWMWTRTMNSKTYFFYQETETFRYFFFIFCSFSRNVYMDYLNINKNIKHK